MDRRCIYYRLPLLESGTMGTKGNTQVHILTQIERALIQERPSGPEDCIKWARLNFQEYFHNAIAQLLHMFPEDQVTDLGMKFWSGSKRCPHVLEFNPQKVEVPEFKPRSNVKIAVTESEAKQLEKSDDDDCDAQLQSVMVTLAKMNKKTVQRLNAIDFEKDDDTNHHMEFITAASNLRAENYSIAPADRLKCGNGYFTLWDRLEVQGPKKMKELLQLIKEEYNLQEETGFDVSMVSCGVSLVYSFFLSNEKKLERLEQE
ncbi:unnamed protein product [Gongylonema pulchrum]|uniref:UBA_e1_thiolCys domain-containing protein n=1 Tax=Gongylonema pulchrum TaxID=637853 RepID=A0A183EEJ2_9BILA|nr:unnamed protein product [Gongylonema pulchrum]